MPQATGIGSFNGKPKASAIMHADATRKRVPGLPLNEQSPAACR
jgi:hypothetical protein